MNEKDFKELLDKYFEGRLSAQEQSTLEAFEKKMLKKDKSELFQSDDLSRDETRIKILHHIQKKIRLHKTFSSLKIAASIAAVVALGFFGYYLTESQLSDHEQPIGQIVKKTDWGQKSNITLSDGTKIKLNSGSILRFPEKFNDSTRLVELSGEAFFEVAKNPDKPFIIKSGELTTTVLGTSFNVAAYEENDNISVTVATGSVQVSSTYNTKAILEPEQQAIFNKDTDSIFTQKVDLTLFLEWKDGIIRFENTSLKEAMKKLERWFNVKITLENENISNCRFTGKFNKESLEVILKSLGNLHKGLDYEFTSDNEILIKGKCTN